jgi:hypothetical protein
MVIMIITGRQWHLRVQESSHMEHQIAIEHGHLMDQMDSTLATPWNIIDVTPYTLPRQEVKGW